MLSKKIVQITEGEKAYRSKYYHYFQVVSKRRLICCSCGNEISSKNTFSHPVLEILQCETCYDTCDRTDFKTERNKCLLCCKYSSYTCRNISCSYEYCRKCIKRNVNKCIQEAEKDDWECFVCKIKPFWELRGICEVAMALSNKRMRHSKHDGESAKRQPRQSSSRQRESSKSSRIDRKLSKICDTSSDESDNGCSRPLYKKGLSDDQASENSVLSSSSSSDDYEPRKRTISNQKSSRKTRVSNRKKSQDREKRESRVTERKNRRKLYTPIKESIEISPVEISSNEDEDSEVKKATSKFKENFSAHFKEVRTLLTKLSSEVDICEKKCLKKSSLNEKDAAEIKKRLENILTEIESESTEKCKQINKTYQSWHKNFKSCLRTRNGFRKRKHKSTSSNEEEEKELCEENEETSFGEKIVLKDVENGVVSECDSEALFSADENRSKKRQKSADRSSLEKSPTRSKSARNGSKESPEMSKKVTKRNSSTSSKSETILSKKILSNSDESDAGNSGDLSPQSNKESAKSSKKVSSSEDCDSRRGISDIEDESTVDRMEGAGNQNNEEGKGISKNLDEGETSEEKESSERVEKVACESEKRSECASKDDEQEKARRKLLESSSDSEAEEQNSTKRVNESSNANSHESSNANSHESFNANSHESFNANSHESFHENSHKNSHESFQKSRDEDGKSSDELVRKRLFQSSSEEETEGAEKSAGKNRDKDSKSKSLESNNETNSEKEATRVENKEDENAKKKLLESSNESGSEKEEELARKTRASKSLANGNVNVEEKAKKKFGSSDESEAEATQAVENLCDKNEEKAKNKLLESSSESDSEKEKATQLVHNLGDKNEEKAKNKLLESSSESESEKELAKKKSASKSQANGNVEEKAKKKLLESSDESNSEKEETVAEETQESASQSASQSASKSASKTSENVSENASGNASENLSENASRNASEAGSETAFENASESAPETTSKTASEHAPKNKVENVEEKAKKKLLESSSESNLEDTPLKEKGISESQSDKKEAEAKKKLLESEVESNSETETPGIESSKPGSKDSETNEKDSSSEKQTNLQSKENTKSKKNCSEEEAKKYLLKSSSDLSSDDSKIDNSIVNGKTTQSFLNSSSDEHSPDLFASFEVKSVKRKRTDSDADNSESCRSRRKKKFKLSKNPYYRADEKLRMSCRVQLERLSRNVLRKHAKSLKRSKRHLEREKLKSAMSMDNMEKIRKRNAPLSSSEDDSDSEAVPRNQKKVNQKEDETLLDHLKKVENGDTKKQEMVQSSESELSDAKSKMKMTNKHLFSEAEKRARDNLLCSSGSDVEMPSDNVELSDSQKSTKKKKGEKDDKKTDKDVEKEQKEQNEQNEQEEQKDDQSAKEDEIKISSDESNEDEEDAKKKKDKAKWKSDKLLRTRISDSDSEVERKKFSKRQQKLKEKKKEDSSSNEEEAKVVVAKKKRTKRKILDSDSDIEIISGCESSSSSDVSKAKEETKKSRKRGARKSTDSDDSLEEKRPKTKRKRIKPVSDSDSDSDAVTNSQSSPIKGGRKNIRKVLKDKQVADDTKQAAKEEEERLKRIAERQKVYNEMYEIRLAGEEKVDKLVLDFDEETKKELVTVEPELVKRLKPHQAQGIKFMWDACFESVERVKNSKGSGCIIAHCMGLGKTFQVVTLVHTLLSHKETGINTVMIVCPLSTALNWAGEFEMWLKDLSNFSDIEIYELGKYKQNFERKYQLEYWKKNGGVLIIGYDMFRNLTATGKRMKKSMQTSMLHCLVDPGPDLIVCDEGHLLKNEDTALSKAMRRVNTLRRIVLTGTPLQNNLIEYHCMVQFVKPNLLGTKKEFSNRFVNPIKNGSTADSTPYDVKLMKKRAFILHNLLEGSVQRFDYSVLTPFLPPKQEYVISVKLTQLQIDLYQYYLDNFTRGFRGPKLFADYHALQRICTHPIVMKMNAEKMEKKRQEEDNESDSAGSLKDFIDDGSDTSQDSSNEENDGSDVQCIGSDKETPAPRRGTRANPVDEPITVEPEIAEPREWWSGMIQPEHFDDMRVSAKLVLLFQILKESEKIGDKILVFSQSLYSLTLIEEFLSRIDDATQNNTESENLENHSGSWSLGLDYFRLDGQTSADNRSQWCKIFNRPSNTRARLFLISTRAGGLGINLTAANRVIIFDASWNPSHDVQSIFRIYRFGQKKPCYIYRFLSKGTMEEKIYNRQVSKLSLACRVIDEQQIERHFNSSDLAEMYTFDPNPPKESQTLNLPKDRLLAEIFLKYKDMVHNYHEHDSLLENQLDEVLDEEERKLAWEEYEDEKKGKVVMQIPHANQFGFNPMNVNMFGQQANIIAEVDTMANFLRKDYPTRSAEELRQLAQTNILNMYSNMVERQTMQRNFPNQYMQQMYRPAMPTIPTSYIQQQQLQHQQQLQYQQQLLRNLQRQQQERFAKMPVAGGAPPAVIDISSPTNNQEE